MSEPKLLTAAELTIHVGGRLIGDGSIQIERVADLSTAGAGEVAYVEDEKFFETGKSSQASCLIAPPQFVASVKDLIVEKEFGPVLIEVTKPKLAFALIAELLHPAKHREPSVHDSAAIAETADIDLTVFIGPHVSIGEGTRVEAGTRIEAGVVIGGQVGFGDHIRVMSGAVIGSKAGVLPGKIVRPGVWWGIPIQPLDEYKRLNAHLARVPEMREEIKELLRRLVELEKDSRES